MNDVSAIEWLARTLTAGAAMLLFGATLFLLYVPRRVFVAAGADGARAWRSIERDERRIALGAVIALACGGVLWLAFRAAAIAGVPTTQAMSSPTARAIVLDTLFGRVALLRLLLIALAALLLVPRREARGVRAASALDFARALVAAAVLATLAWSGHAVAGTGRDRLVQVTADTLHLVAAGAWTGALPLLAPLLARAVASKGAADAAIAARTTARFSPIGIACVGALVVTGTVNAVYLIGHPAELFGTRYGQLLLAKLVLFVAMVVLATSNRRRLVAMSGDTATAATAFRRIAGNATLEAVLGLAIVGIVGVLGASVPAMHAPIVWPLPFALDWREAAEPVHAWRLLALAAAAVAAVALAWLAGRARPLVRIAAIVSAVAALAGAGWMVAVPAFPTTYARVPVPYAVPSIDRGARIYAANCAPCHGAEGRGDGPLAASLEVTPENLVAGHAAMHTPGHLYWQVTHGIAATPMPAFGGRLTDGERWDAINFLRALVEAERARALMTSVRLEPAVVAPDFAFELAGGPQQSLRERRGRVDTLLVLYTLPESAPRLSALAANRAALDAHGVRVVAVPLHGAAVDDASNDRAILAHADPALAATYALFLRANGAQREPSAHAELLIDRQGYLRARWLVLPVPSDSIAEIARAAARADELPLPDPDTPPHSH